ncbi:hypothetical protein FA95DRAFT_1552861 [Auriscalpium vulgare]|uniref:Uncharacterized protein n=1 Tax=Auriscalpium vulgare TaxID=40419 RepID=A0ACB8S9W4_9AGAM|nr:hypothetical protein FA95DRAFT_1552861 [Auriscalpium vulgare]
MAYSSRSQSPPPRMPSPTPLPTPLPSPRPFPRKSSRQRLLVAPDSPPIPPTLIGSPLLTKGVFAQRPKHTHVLVDVWADGVDFGARRENTRSLPSPPRERLAGRSRHRRVASISLSVSASPGHTRARARSPPPSPRRPSSPPPVPPIPAAILAASPKKPVLQPRSTNHPELLQIPDLADASYTRPPSIRPTRSTEAMTCMRFFSIHNNRGVI